MIKRLSVMLLVIIVAGCTKNSKVVPGCPLKACTDIFVSIGVTFTDNNDQPIAIENLRVIDLSSHLNLTKSANSPFWALGYYVIADDGDLKKLSADGDNIQVSATDPATKQTKTVIFKIAGGGCNCHVFKVSGPNRIAFN